MLSIRLSAGQTLRIEDQVYRLLRCKKDVAMLVVNEERVVKLDPEISPPIVVQTDVDGQGTDALLHISRVYQADQQCKLLLDSPIRLKISEFAVFKNPRPKLEVAK